MPIYRVNRVTVSRIFFLRYSLLSRGFEIKFKVMVCVVIQANCRINSKENIKQCMFATEL